MTSRAEARSGVIAGGNWIVDHIKLIDDWPPQDTLVNVRGEMRGNGGSPYNLLKNLAKLGAGFPLEAIGLIGADSDGASILEDCRLHGINVGQLRQVKGLATSYTDVMTVQGTGRRTFFHCRGANALLGPRHFDFSATNAAFFHLGYLLLLDAMDELENGVPRAREVFARAHAAGMQTSLDCVTEHSERFQAVVLPVLPEVDLLFANDTEAEKLAGIAVRSAAGVIEEAGMMAAARRLLELGVRRWVVLHAPEAACAIGPNGMEYWQPSVRVPQSAIRGVAGAGDAFASGVLLGLAQGSGMPEALRLGVCVAASSLTHPACSDGILAAPDCVRLGEAWGFR